MPGRAGEHELGGLDAEDVGEKLQHRPLARLEGRMIHRLDRLRHGGEMPDGAPFDGDDRVGVIGANDGGDRAGFGPCAADDGAGVAEAGVDQRPLAQVLLGREALGVAFRQVDPGLAQ